MMPCVDPLTGATSIRLLDYNRFRKITCIDLILPKPSGSKVTRMTIHDGPVIHVREECTAHSPYVDVWGHTQLRGFYRIIPNQHSIDPMENQHVMKFTADMRQDPCAVSCSQMAPAEWSEAADPKVDMTGTEIRFDGLRERLCYVHPQVEHEIVVVEIE
ncbi:hypothetical protein OG21DRAFT_567285 [Imleria badia]|nr:hypothetical protein OG21DRAFT_567285 [Imleria badia]